MKIQKSFEGTTKTLGWKEIESIISDNYSERRQVDELLEGNPQLDIEVKFNLEITIK